MERDYSLQIMESWVKKNTTDFGTILRNSCSQFPTDFVPDIPIILNSVPKCGTHLLRNVIMHFISWDNISHSWVNMHNYGEICSLIEQDKKFFTGHLARDLKTSRMVENLKKIILIRDPKMYALSLARALYHQKKPWWTDIADFIQEHQIPFYEAVSYAIVGEHHGKDYIVPLNVSYIKYAIQWFDDADIIVRYEDLIKHIQNIDTPASYQYFNQLLTAIGIPMPDDWKQRVKAGARTSISASYIKGQCQDEEGLFTEAHSMMLELVAPGLRKLLGYEGDLTKNLDLDRVLEQLQSSIASLQVETSLVMNTLKEMKEKEEIFSTRILDEIHKVQNQTKKKKWF